MNFCPNCGSKLDGKVRFCPNCGAPVAGQGGADSSFGSEGAGAAGSGQQMSIETDYSRYRGYEDYASGTRSAGSQYTNAGDGAYSGGAYSSGNAQGAGAYGNAGAQRTRAYTGRDQQEKHRTLRHFLAPYVRDLRPVLDGEGE